MKYAEMGPVDYRAYGEYCALKGLQPTLSTYPKMFFVNGKGETIMKNISEVYKELGYRQSPQTGRWSRPKDLRKP